MDSLLGFRHSIATSLLHPLPFCSTRKFFTLKAKLSHQEDDSIYQSAIQRASLRLYESNRPDPLFIDPYVACLVPPDTEVDMKSELHPYCLATKFIDDKLLSAMKNNDELKQVVLLTDGMDTRPYRLNWPRSTMIFDISPERVSKVATRKLEDIGAKVPRSCLFVHAPSDSSSIEQTLTRRGFNGARPSIWVLQIQFFHTLRYACTKVERSQMGIPIMNLESFEEILLLVDSLATKDCFLLGELPAWLVDTDVGGKSDAGRWMDRIFLNNGFHVDMLKYNQIGENLTREIATEAYQFILFMAKHLRYSDSQMDTWMREFQRIEEEGDEEGFEEL